MRIVHSDLTSDLKCPYSGSTGHWALGREDLPTLNRAGDHKASGSHVAVQTPFLSCCAARYSVNIVRQTCTSRLL